MIVCLNKFHFGLWICSFQEKYTVMLSDVAALTKGKQWRSILNIAIFIICVWDWVWVINTPVYKSCSFKHIRNKYQKATVTFLSYLQYSVRLEPCLMLQWVYYYVTNELPAWINYSSLCHKTDDALIMTDIQTRQCS